MEKKIKELINQFFRNSYELTEDDLFVSFKINFFEIKDFKCIQIGYFLELFAALKQYNLNHIFNLNASLIEITNVSEGKVLLAKCRKENVL